MKKINFLTYRKSLNRCSLDFDSSVPFLTFTYFCKTHKLVSSNYYRRLNINQSKLHKEILRLQEKGLSYRKIHKELIKNGFKIGKSPSTVHSIIKKREKRDDFLNQPVVEGYRDFIYYFISLEKVEFYHQPIMDGYGNFRVEWREG